MTDKSEACSATFSPMLRCFLGEQCFKEEQHGEHALLYDTLVQVLRQHRSWGSRRYWRKIYGKLQSLYDQQLQNNFVDTETPVSIRGLN